MELELEENRFHHIIGLNNIGKSSLLKAIECVVNNVSSRVVKEFIRDEAESFMIEVTDFNYNKVRLSRGKEDYYWWIIDGKEGRVDGTAGKVPEEVKEYFNFYDDFERTKEIINIRPPRSKLLFVDTTFGENYFLLQKALRIEEFLAAIKLGDSRKREVRKSIVDLTNRVEEEKDSIDNTLDLGPVLDDISVYEKAGDTYFERVSDIDELMKLNRDVEEKENWLENNSMSYDRDYVTELVSKLVLMRDVIRVEKDISSKEDELGKLSLIREEFEGVRVLKDKLVNVHEKKKVIDRVNELGESVESAERELYVKESIIANWKESNILKKVEVIKEAGHITEEGVRLREVILELKDKEVEFVAVEEEKKQFMLDHKFCPVVMSMRDRTCPFSGKSILELIG